MGVNGCVYGCPSCRSIDRPDFRDARFVQVGTYNGAAFVSGSDDGRGFGSAFHHHYLKTQPLSVGFFSARFPSVGAVPGAGLFSGTPLAVPISGPFSPVFSLCSLSGSLPKSAPNPAKTRVCARPVVFFVCWRNAEPNPRPFPDADGNTLALRAWIR